MAGSGNRLAVAKSAARTFVDALRPDDQVMVLAIGSEIEIVAPLSTDRRGGARGDRSARRVGHDAAVRRQRRRARRHPGGQGTAGARAAVGRHRSLQRRRARGPASSSAGAATCWCIRSRSARRARRCSRSSRRRPAGARSMRDDPRELATTLATIARELRSQYLLGYAPRASRWRRMPRGDRSQVTVDAAGRARSRARRLFWSK